MLQGRRYRLHPTAGQAESLSQYLGATRALWNTALAHRQMMWRQWKISVSYVDQARELTIWRGDEEWVRQVPSAAQQQVLRDLDQAHRNWWRGTHGPPQFRSRRTAGSIRFPVQACGRAEKLNRRWSEVRLPKLGPVRFRQTRPLGGEVRSITVTRDSASRWWISFLIEDGAEPAALRPGPTVGVDLGVATSVVTSDRRTFQCPKPTAPETLRLRRLQQRLARQVKGSNGRERTKHQIARHHSRQVNRASDWAHKTTNELVADGGVVGFENLNIAAMTKSASGTIEAPGTNVAQKRGLNRSILASGWGQVRDMSAWKGERVGTKVVLVPAAFTSQRCSDCGFTNPKNRESQAVFECVSCGHRDHADVNAAINIGNAAGQAVSACGDLGVARSVKHEPPVLVSGISHHE